ncbi:MULTISPECIES: AAA family ATPase [unclassified Massilia]|uniref:AAA family ATPase n=1 Tax=unclassified Massilia TaxID=2609279 RepID=UPI001785C13E|nr:MULTISPECIES: AAA family ATPase [unclassified Massilia]MBD8528384.1 AAA family ATPase [Massilia sp. CFBP 13647]MBD8671994.1 AAA family ATPase [Massilia sp. CFBP 13721]
MSGATQPAVFVVFEGLDGTGKSTCAQALAQRIGARYMTTPAPELRQLRQKVLDSFSGSQEAAQLFYLSTVFAASAEVRGLLDQGIPVVMDRYFLSTQVYACFRGSRLALDDAASALVHATLTVCLHAPLAMRRERLRRRGSTPSDEETLSPVADRQLREGYRTRSSLPVAGTWFDYPGLASPSRVVDAVVRRLAALAERGDAA